MFLRELIGLHGRSMCILLADFAMCTRASFGAWCQHLFHSPAGCACHCGQMTHCQNTPMICTACHAASCALLRPVQMRQTPKVGPYTAAAVASIAFSDPDAAVNGNSISAQTFLGQLYIFPTAASCGVLCPVQMRQIPGVGPYTAAAVASIAFNDPAAAVDGNVIRVISRLRALKGNPTKMAKTWDRLAAELLHQERPGCHNQVWLCAWLSAGCPGSA